MHINFPALPSSTHTVSTAWMRTEDVFLSATMRGLLLLPRGLLSVQVVLVLLVATCFVVGSATSPCVIDDDGMAEQGETRSVVSGTTVKSGLMGVNGGPLSFHPTVPGTSFGFVDVVEQFKEMGITEVRTHDFFGPFDVMCFFPVADSNDIPDPLDDANYFWGPTDDAYQKILDTNAAPFVRLGQGWRNFTSWGPYPHDTAPEGYPPGFECDSFWPNIANVSMEVGSDVYVKLLERLSDTSRWGRDPLDGAYVELWNEPNTLNINQGLPYCFACSADDASTCSYEYPHYEWDGTPQEFYEFFADVVDDIREKFPQVRVGGPGLHGGFCPGQAAFEQALSLEWVEGFLAYLQERGTEVDFISWHTYASDPQDFVDCGNLVQSLLEKYGLGDVEVIVSEYQVALSFGDAAIQSTLQGAATLTSIWSTTITSGVDIDHMHITRGQDGPYVPYGVGFPLCANNSGNASDPFEAVPDVEMYFGEYGFGLIYGNGTLKPSGAAFSLWQSYVDTEVVAIDPLLLSYTIGDGGDASDLYVLITESLGAGRSDDGTTVTYRLLISSLRSTSARCDLTVIEEAFGVEYNASASLCVESGVVGEYPSQPTVELTSLAPFHACESAKSESERDVLLVKPFGVYSLVFEQQTTPESTTTATTTTTVSSTTSSRSLSSVSQSSASALPSPLPLLVVLLVVAVAVLANE